MYVSRSEHGDGSQPQPEHLLSSYRSIEHIGMDEEAAAATAAAIAPGAELAFAIVEAAAAAMAAGPPLPYPEGIWTPMMEIG